MNIVRTSRLAGLLLLACIAGACGGGGGSEGPHLSLSASTVALAAEYGDLNGPSQNIHAELSSSVRTIAYGTADGQLPDWLSVGGVWTGRNTLSLNFTSTSQELLEGTYSTVVTFYALDKNSDVLAQTDVTVTYALDAHVGYPYNAPGASFVFGSSVTTAEVKPFIHADGESWTATSDTPWISVAEGVRQGTREMTLTLNAAGMPVGGHTGTVRVAAVGETDDFVDIPVYLTVVAPRISASGTPLLGGSLGLAKEPVPLTFTLNTGTNEWPWTAEFQYGYDQPTGWLGLDRLSGTVGAAGDSVMVQGNWTDLPRGSHSGTIVFRLQVDGVEFVQSRPVSIRYEENRIYVVENGIALYDLPGRARTQASLQVINSQGRLDVPWTAQSDSAWLTVTPSGNTGGMLELTADAAALAADEVHVARVTIHSTDPEIQNDETIVASFWKSATTPGALDIETSFTRLAANPTLPYIHVLSGSSLRTYNVYNGELVSTVTLPTDTGEGLVVGSDGLTAFAPGPFGTDATVIDVLTGAVSTVPHLWRIKLPFWRLEGISHFYRSEDASTLNLDYLFASITVDGRYCVGAGNNAFAGEFLLKDFSQIDHSALQPTLRGIGPVHMWWPGTIAALAAVPDKQHALAAVSQPAELRLYDTVARSLSWAKALPKPPNNALVRADGLLVTGAAGEDGDADVWLFDLDGTSMGQYPAPSGSLLDHQLAVSSDRGRLIIPTGTHIGIIELPALGTPIPLD